MRAGLTNRRPGGPGGGIAPTSGGLEVDGEGRSFGRVYLGDELRAELTVRNTSPGEAKAVFVNTGCGCIRAAVEPPTVPPGGMAKLSIVWTPDKTPGEAKRSVAVLYTTGGVTRAPLLVPLRAEVARRVVGCDAPLTFDPAAGEQHGSRHVRRADGQPVRVTATASHPSLQLQCGHDPAGGSRLTVRFDPSRGPVPPGAELSIHVHTDVPWEPEFSIPVRLAPLNHPTPPE